MPLQIACVKPGAKPRVRCGWATTVLLRSDMVAKWCGNKRRCSTILVVGAVNVPQLDHHARAFPLAVGWTSVANKLTCSA